MRLRRSASDLLLNLSVVLTCLHLKNAVTRPNAVQTQETHFGAGVFV